MQKQARRQQLTPLEQGGMGAASERFSPLLTKIGIDGAIRCDKIAFWAKPFHLLPGASAVVR